MIGFQVVQSGGVDVGHLCCRGGAAVRGCRCLDSVHSKPRKLGQAGVDVQLDLDRLSLLDRNKGHVAGFGEEDRDHWFASASRSLEFYHR